MNLLTNHSDDFGKEENAVNIFEPRTVKIGTHKENNFRSRIAEHFLLMNRARHSNPLRRVTPREFIQQEFDYDKEKYREMLLEAAETVLGYFGFDRTVYLDPPKKNRKWWSYIIDERQRDVEDEIV